MRTKLAIVVTRVAQRQLQNPALQKALGAVALAALERITHSSIDKLRRLERRLRRYDEVIECEWWECPEKQVTEK
jgi:hypothetical protein